MTDIAGAEKKLRQATFFMGHLAHPLHGGDPEHLEFYYSACLSAAKSVFNVLKKSGGPTFKTVYGQLPEGDRSQIDRLRGLRDTDVHQASTGAKPLSKHVPEEPSRYTIFGPRASVFGSQASVEMENPDGSKVEGPVLRASFGLYVKRRGRLIEATTASREFITQLRSLVDKMKAANSEAKTA